MTMKVMLFLIGANSAVNEHIPMKFGEPAPVPNTLPSMHDLVAADMESRKKFGYNKYNSLLQPFNGRDALKDAYEEVLDLAVYLRQAMYERENGDSENG